MTEYLDWKVGDRVVHIDGGKCTPNTMALKRKYQLSFPRAGTVYTIRAIVPIIYHGKPAIGIRLYELDNSHCQAISEHGGEPAFHIQYFRKVQPRETDISCFTALLHDKPARETA
jgi:hypothetical protein